MEESQLCESLQAKKCKIEVIEELDESCDVFSDEEDVKEEKVVVRPEWNVPESMMKRITEHKIADQRITELFKESIRNASFEAKGMTKDDVRKMKIAIANFMKVYLDDNKTDEELVESGFYEESLPDAFSPVSIFPVHYIATVGAAGTGKSESVKAFLGECMDMFTTSSTNSASEEFTKSFVSCNTPNCRDFEKDWRTLIKTLSIPFSHKNVQDMMKRVSQNSEGEIGAELFTLEERYIDFCRSWDEKILKMETKKLMIENLKAMRELMKITYYNLKKNFTQQGHYKFRLGGLPKKHKFYQDPESTFDWINKFDSIERAFAELKKDQSVTNEQRKVCQGLAEEPNLRAECQFRMNARAYIDNQDTYKEYCSSFCSMNKQPHVLSQHDIAMVEEDGKTPVFLLHYHSVLVNIINMIYNPPCHHTRPAVWFSSGSDAQIGAVNAVSALSHVISSDYNVTARGEFYRRNQTSITSAVSEVSRVLPIVLENNMEITHETFESLAFNEKLPQHIRDPAHFSDGKRFHFIHKDNNEFISRMETSKKATIPVYDLLSVSNNIIEITGNKGGDVGDINPYGVTLDDLSNLTYKQSRYNRMMMWRKKMTQEYSRAINNPELFRAKLEVCNEKLMGVSRKINYPTHSGNMKTYDKMFDCVQAKIRQTLSMEKKRLKNEESVEDKKQKKQAQKDEGEEDQEVSDIIMKVVDDDVINEEPMEKSTDDDESEKSEDEDDENMKEIYIERKIEAERNEAAWGGKNVSNNATAEKKSIPKRTKVFITLPAKMALTAAEHLKCREQSKNIVSFLGDGAVYADKCHTNARKADQLGEFTYDAASDLVVIYSGVDFENCEKGRGCKGDNKYDIEKLTESAMENEQSCQMFMTFTRRRMFAQRKELCHLGTRTTVTPRGVNGTINDIMKDQAFNNAGVSAGFKLLVYAGAIHDFLLQKAVRMLREDASGIQAEVELIKKLGEQIGESDPDLKSIIDNYIPILESAQNKDKEMKENWKKKKEGDKDENKGEKKKKDNLATFICKKLDLMRGVITKIIKMDPDRAANNELSFYLHESPLYDQRFLIKAVNSVRLDMYGDITLTFLGNSDHPALERIVNEAKDNMLNMDIRFGQKHFAKEARLNRRGRNKTYAQICGWGLEDWFPERWYSSSLVMKIGSVLVATTDPAPPPGNINWHDIFGDKSSTLPAWKQPKQSMKFGLMTKLNMPALQDGDKFIFNQSFTSQKGDFLNFPVNWSCGSGPEGSDVIVKMSTGRTTNEVMYYDPKRSEVKDTIKFHDKKNSVFDGSHVHAFPVPCILDLTMTSHAAQGKTIRGKVMIDFESMVSKNTKDLIFDEATTKAAALVCATRADNPLNLHTANTAKLSHLFVKPASAQSEKKRRKMKVMFKTELVR